MGTNDKLSGTFFLICPTRRFVRIVFQLIGTKLFLPDIQSFYFQLEEGAIKEDGEGKEEPDFIETHCHWKDCDREYGTQDELVKVRDDI